MRAILLFLCAAVAASAQTTVSLSTVGPRHVFLGSSMYTKVFIKIDNPPAAFSHLYVNRVTAPEGVEVRFSYPHAPLHRSLCGRELIYAANSAFLVEIKPAKLGRGEVAVEFQLQASSGNRPVASDPGVFTTLRIAYTAVPMSGALPPLDVSRWESSQTWLGAKWCDAGKTYQFGYEGDAWYYDGGRVYFQIADYTGDPKWKSCAFHIVDQYRDNLLERNGGIQAWRVFPHGLERAHKETGDERYKQAVLAMAERSTFVSRGGDPLDEYIRETAYLIELWISAERLGAGRHPKLERAVDFLLGHFDGLFVTGNFRLHQTFFDGLAAEALIEWYNHTSDPRVLPAVRSMLDWIWTSGWNRDIGKMVYNPEPAGPRCDDGCQSWGRVWINLVLPAFGWYYSVTGDRTYIERGDELWKFALYEDISYSGKIFSQNYRWSGDYLRYRGQ